MRSMKRNNNQWAKYVAVVLTFMIMAGFFLPGAKAEVKATEGTESAEMEGESNEPVPLASWSVSISFDTNGGGFSEEVKKAYSQMMEAFNLFLFETLKEQFASNAIFTKCCDKYIDSVQDALNDYQNNMSKLRQEYDKLKGELEQIKKGGYCED